MREDELQTMVKNLICDRVWIQNLDLIDWKNFHALRSTADIQAYIDERRRALIVDLIATMPALLKERIVIHRRFPADWWQAFKLRWFPLWLVKKYPVAWEEINIDQPIYAAVCPHVDVSGVKDQGTHLRWMVQKQEQFRQADADRGCGDCS